MFIFEAVSPFQCHIFGTLQALRGHRLALYSNHAVRRVLRNIIVMFGYLWIIPDIPADSRVADTMRGSILELIEN